MRYIKRDPALAPHSLRIPGGNGENEKNKIALHYQTKGVKKFDKFKAYKEPDVQLAIKSQFFDKCVYCESSYVATSPVDIEHYRPKGGVTEEADHLGYWWLAGVWTNLLASCPDCNRSRYQKIIESTTTGSSKSQPRLSGKDNFFPINGVRAKCEADDLSLEDPLLIDPTVRDPCDHLTFTTDTMLSVVLPNILNGSNDPYGDTSIVTYGLNRSGLVDARTTFLQGMKFQADAIEAMLFAAVQEGVSKNVSDSLIGSAFVQLDALKSKKEVKNIYSALAATFYDKFFSDISKKYADALKK